MSKLTTIDFHGAKLVAIAGDRPETTLVAMKPIVEGMGLDWDTQKKKLATHHLLSSWKVNSTFQMEDDDQSREHVMLPLNRVPMWLTTIQPRKIPDLSIRARVIEFQTEAADVLFNHFFGKAIAQGDHLSAKETGGIVKAGLGKLKREVMEEIRAEFAPVVASMKTALTSFDPSAAFVTDHHPILHVIEEFKVPQKGRRGLSSKCSKLCERWLQATGRGGMIRISRETGRKMFKEAGLKAWLAAEGSSILIAARDKAAGQSILPFPKGGQRKRS